MAMSIGHVQTLEKNASAPPRHPWLLAFAENPAIELNDFLQGLADIAPFTRLDPPEAALTLFDNLAEGKEYIDLLDETLVEWLASVKRTPISADANIRDKQAFSLINAFRITALLSLPKAAKALRLHYISWVYITSSMISARNLDARYAYFHTLALTQQLNETGNSLLPLWYKICHEAGGGRENKGDYPPYYIGVGLLGIRKSGIENVEEALVSALAGWAIARTPIQDTFNLHWKAVKAFYPRGDKFWAETLAKTLNLANFKGAAEAFSWKNQPLRQGVMNVSAPRDTDTKEAINSLSKPFKEIELALEIFVAKHNRYVEQTGDTEWLVKAFNRLSAALMKGREAKEKHVVFAFKILIQSLSWQRHDAITYGELAKCLNLLDKQQQAEFVLWERIRLFPDDVIARNQLGHLLLNDNQLEEAEALYRETIDLFPDDVIARTQLGMLLLKSNQLEEAEALYIETIDLFPDNVVARNQYAILLLKTNRHDEAIAMFNQVLALDNADEVATNMLLKLSGAKTPEEEIFSDEEAEQLLIQMSDGLPKNEFQTPFVKPQQPTSKPTKTPQKPIDMSILDEICYNGELHRLHYLWQRDGEESYKIELERLAAEKPSSYSELIQYRMNDNTAPQWSSFAIAFEQALNEPDLDQLNLLSKTYPRLEILSLVIKSLYGDEASIKRVEAMLALQEMQIKQQSPLEQFFINSLNRMKAANENWLEEDRKVYLLCQQAISAAA